MKCQSQYYADDDEFTCSGAPVPTNNVTVFISRYVVVLIKHLQFFPEIIAVVKTAGLLFDRESRPGAGVFRSVLI